MELIYYYLFLNLRILLDYEIARPLYIVQYIYEPTDDIDQRLNRIATLLLK